MSKIAKAIADAIFNAKVGCGYESVLNGLREDIDTVGVKVWREDESVKFPFQAFKTDAGVDLYVHSVETRPDGSICYHTGLHFKLPEDYYMEICPRSSITNTRAVMQNAPGILDENYTGELTVVQRAIDGSGAQYKVGERIAQVIVRRRERIKWVEVQGKEDLGDTDRGDGGYGSTGK